MSLHSMEKRMELALNNLSDIPHDVVFIVGKEKTRISCHKLMLTMASDVFQRMLTPEQCKSEDLIKSVSRGEDSKPSVFHADSEGPSCSDKASDEVKYNTGDSYYKRRKITNFLEISLLDVNPAGLKNLINYVYIRKLDKIPFEETLETMHCAVLYDITELIEHGLMVLSSGDINMTNAIGIFQAADYCNNIQIREKAWKFIEENSAAFLDIKEFLQLSEKNLRNFLLLDVMPDLNSEIEIFNAVLKWGRHKCESKGLERTAFDIRKILGNVVHLIRFPVMNTDDFNDLVVPSGMLSPKECLPVYKYFTSSKEKRLTLANELKYSCNSRTPMRTLSTCNAIITNDLNILKRGVYDTFYLKEGSRNLILTGFGVVLPENYVPTEMIQFSLWDDTNQLWITSSKKILNKCLEVSYLKFDHGVTVRPGVKYMLCVNFNNKGYKTIVSNPVGVVQYPKNSLNTHIFNWKIGDNQQFGLKFTTNDCIVWGLQFQH